MLWKSDQNIGGAATPTQMWSQPLTADGLGLTGRPRRCIMQPDEPWQGTIVEAPDMVEVGGAYWVFYSGNWFNQPAYAIGAARCAGPQGPCSDTSPTPAARVQRPGPGAGRGLAFADASGVWMLYSPWRSLAPHPDFAAAGGHHPARLRRPPAPTWPPAGRPPSLDALGPAVRPAPVASAP